MIPAEQVEAVDDFTSFGVHAFTTTRMFGNLGSASDEPVRAVMSRWDAIRTTLAARGVRRLATASQVHGVHIIVHEPGWEGWLRGNEADGHVSPTRGMALAVTIADCIPVFFAHPSGAIALLHSGWRGTADRFVERGIETLARRGFPASELRLHLGPAICGKCYEVSPEVARLLTGEPATAPRNVDLRALVADQARASGVRMISISPSCTKCNNDKFFSHRAGDHGRQVGVIVAS